MVIWTTTSASYVPGFASVLWQGSCVFLAERRKAEEKVVGINSFASYPVMIICPCDHYRIACRSARVRES
jgi:hypothetical protein